MPESCIALKPLKAAGTEPCPAEPCDCSHTSWHIPVWFGCPRATVSSCAFRPRFASFKTLSAGSSVLNQGGMTRDLSAQITSSVKSSGNRRLRESASCRSGGEHRLFFISLSGLLQNLRQVTSTVSSQCDVGSELSQKQS
jgi:hypothetical protein